jgi:DNA invertase Pin-like site-specific DNA recombinase
MPTPSPLPRGSRVVGYFRDSGGARQERSVDQQVEIYQKYCSEHGLIDTGLFQDEARKGSTTRGRDNFKRLVAYLEQKPRPCEGVALWASNRFSRNQEDSKYYKSGIRRLGYTIIYISGDVPNMGRATPVIEAMVEWKDEEYLAQLSKDISRGLSDAFDAGHFPSGRIPPGYKSKRVQWDTHRDGTPRYRREISVDESRKTAALNAFEMRAAGVTYRRIGRELKLYPKRKKEGDTSVKRMLHNPIYKGELHVQGKVYQRPDLQIVTPDLWDRVQAINSNKYGRLAPRAKSSTYLLSGFAYCVCGGKLWGRNLTHMQTRISYAYYVCNNKCGRGSHGRDDLEAATIKRIVNDILQPEYVMARVEGENRRRSSANTSLSDKIASARDTVKRLEKEIKNIAATLADMPLSTTLARRLIECEEELPKARYELDQCEKEQSKPIDLKKALAEAEIFRNRLAELDPEITKATLLQIISRITVDKNSIEIEYLPLSV